MEYNIGLVVHDYLGIGDKVQFSHIPENFYHFTGSKVYDLSNTWIFDHNPFVKRDLSDIDPSNLLILDLWELSHYFAQENFKSHAERFFMFFNDRLGTNFINPRLRHPRLYKYEDSTQLNRIVVHTTGRSEIQPMSDEIIKQIELSYKNYEIIQIGGPNDKKTPFESYLGKSIWETVKLISESLIFIGVNSGMMNIANCFPKVQKKIVLPRNAESFAPMTLHNCWFDHGNMYFNYTTNDIGATFSYLKI